MQLSSPSLFKLHNARSQGEPPQRFWIEQPDKLECFVPGNEKSEFTSTDDRLDRKTNRNGADIQSMYLLY